MVFDHRPTEGAEGNPERDDPCIGKLSIPLASHCEWTRARATATATGRAKVGAASPVP